jgi:RsiW-degrading membrane proteinase PrsW (M82 family)
MLVGKVISSLLLCWVGVHGSIYKGSYTVSNISEGDVLIDCSQSSMLFYLTVQGLISFFIYLLSKQPPLHCICFALYFSQIIYFFIRELQQIFIFNHVQSIIPPKSFLLPRYTNAHLYCNHRRIMKKTKQLPHDR